MRPRAQSYRTLDGLASERDGVPWYWRLVAAGSSFMILGGYLMLPASWEKNPDDDMRIKRDAVGIFAVALLTAGLSFTGLVSFAVRNTLFQRDSVFIPALTSCVLGLLTVFYDFLIFTRYQFKTPALLTTIAAAVSTVVYAILLVLCQRRLTHVKSRTGSAPSMNVPLQTHHPRNSESTLATSLGPESSYYENYTRNMFPTAYTNAPIAPAEYVPQQITEEEMQRQQMLMLLLQQKDQPSTPDPSASTFHIDWQGRDEEDAPPANGYYAPQSAQSQRSNPYPVPGIVRSTTNEMRPWDGIWRTADVRRVARQREEMERTRR